MTTNEELRARVRELEAEVERLSRDKAVYREAWHAAVRWRKTMRAERDALQQRLDSGLTWAQYARNHGVATGGLFAALASPAVSSRPGMTVTEAVADALADRSENRGQITGGTPQEPQQADEAGGTGRCTGTGCAGCAKARAHYRLHGCLISGCTDRHARQPEPVERITDANGDELEHGADTDAQTAQQQDRSDR